MNVDHYIEILGLTYDVETTVEITQAPVPESGTYNGPPENYDPGVSGEFSVQAHKLTYAGIEHEFPAWLKGSVEEALMEDQEFAEKVWLKYGDE
jgi:hypothetical protein